MEKQPLVSVVIPAYNCEKYIAETLDSVISQTYSNLEIIVVNDCSKDNTEEIIFDYMEREPRIRYIKNEINSGVAKTRNNGVDIAKGEWVALVDSDDCWLREKIQKQMELLAKTAGFFCCTGRELMGSEGNSLYRYIVPQQMIAYKDLLQTNSIVCSSVLCKSAIIREFPMMHDDVHEDYLVWLKITKKYGIVYGLGEPLVRYRVLNNSKSGNKLKSFVMTYNVYKLMNLHFFQRMYYLFHYSIHGLKNYWI